MGLLLGGWVKMLAKGKCMIGKVRIINLYDGLVYIRGVNGEDLSTFIKSVTFTLHQSFRQNQRSISKKLSSFLAIDHFPFEVREQGWGEFEIAICVEFKNDAELPITFNHPLKLHPGNDIPSEMDVVDIIC